ncbi:MAG: UDP-4-amino-4,6-dideoxy-N-acetyl-beta-L-altrosamine N-acetyltransferase [Emcibacter sp.]|nr:UDP-4-amino-4,6-dideoxy-N-acetyl-beta-L-altrosamine N-acetyltransferase [Emcibacter sp.]
MIIKDETSTRTIKLLPLNQISTETQLKIRDMRNDLDIRQWMYTDHFIGLNEHLGWLHDMKRDESQIVFVVTNDKDQSIGIVSVNDIDLRNKKASWAYYLTKNARGGLGSAIEYSIINFIFDSLDIQKLNCEVLEGNEAVLKLHKKFLFQEEGFRRSQILKENKYLGVHFLGLLRNDWQEGRDALFKQYQKSFDKFSIEIKWGAENSVSERHPLDEIEDARSRNNLNWMNIMRLVLELSPEIGKELVREIRNTDKEISALTDKLISL